MQNSTVANHKQSQGHSKKKKTSSRKQPSIINEHDVDIVVSAALIFTTAITRNAENTPSAIRDNSDLTVEGVNSLGHPISLELWRFEI